ncbi:hypothetical protein NBG4_390017 [Candidatus Sulfobium mesophilum]|uniref:DUF116 domain-containing protein n=1 Tax=Candidatus Sulfobium mesophilum TaxID=2016548 RepID=A0A2U3QHR8_9BACT|nr:hypothetical protein NBG4_390017 [Candidatus Sulfobium mesophilum]
MAVSYKAVSGKTYSLFGSDTSTDLYFRTIRTIADSLLVLCPDPRTLLLHVQKAGGMRFKKGSDYAPDDALIAHIRKTLHDALHAYTQAVREHLKGIPFSQRFDKTIGTKEEGYHLYMLEIELVNRIYREAFRKSDYKFALLPHCLRDFRPQCKSVPGDMEYICMGCTEDCFVRLGSRLLKKYGIEPYISVTTDQERLFRRLKEEHPNIGALGIACIPELAQAMRLCINLGIPPIGIPLSANRCARWMRQAYETSFSLEELEELI